MNVVTQSFSIYKGVVVVVQLVLIYLGFIVVSVVDKYYYYGILWNALAAGNVVVTGIACVWICLTLPLLRLIRNLMRTRNLRLRATKKDF